MNALSILTVAGADPGGGGFNDNSGADPGFQVRGSALKKIAPSGGRREKFWGISCEKSRFYDKKSYVGGFLFVF
jgi:hypothetical protein